MRRSSYKINISRCEKCDKSLDGVGYFEENKEIICAECYEEHFAIKCHKCGQSLNTTSGTEAESTKTRIITCEEKNYHVDCYSCKVRQSDLIILFIDCLVSRTAMTAYWTNMSLLETMILFVVHADKNKSIKQYNIHIYF